MDIEAFLSADKSIVIAPAGYGKTHTIAEAIAAYNGQKKVLVLTHTHAGIASLKKKFEEQHIPAPKYHLDTICSYALAMTKTYHINKDEIPSEAQTSAMFKFAVEHATKILHAKPIKRLLNAKYDHLIVDEYQDCTESQHRMIMEMSVTLKTHLLGDPLQGIFGFKEPIVSFKDPSFAPFYANCHQLDTPWRWRNASRNDLGQDLALIREKLNNNEDVNLGYYNSIEFLPAPETDYTQPRSAYKQKVFEVLRDESVLLIHPRSENPAGRVKFIQQFPQLRMIESIDDKSYYDFCDTFDRKDGNDLVVATVEMMRELAKASAINVWFNDNCNLKRKSEEGDLRQRNKLAGIIEPLMARKSYGIVAALIEAIQNLPEVKVYRKDMIEDLCKALRDADRLGLTAKEAIERNRNIIRRKGRRILGKGIGTTLLTKGLEYDTVVVLNAHQFKDRKQLYVALTRCCRRLVVIAKTPVLHPYD